jgi:hypothetical protein
VRARAAGAPGPLHFRGKRPPAGAPRFLALADIVASPRRKGVNTPSRSTRRISASGRPLLATRILSHTQVLDDATAWLVDPTPDALAAGSVTLLAHPDEGGAAAPPRGRALIAVSTARSATRERVEAAYAHIAAAALSGDAPPSVQR